MYLKPYAWILNIFVNPELVSFLNQFRTDIQFLDPIIILYIVHKTSSVLNCSYLTFLLCCILLHLQLFPAFRNPIVKSSDITLCPSYLTKVGADKYRISHTNRGYVIWVDITKGVVYLEWVSKERNVPLSSRHISFLSNPHFQYIFSLLAVSLICLKITSFSLFLSFFLSFFLHSFILSVWFGNKSGRHTCKIIGILFHREYGTVWCAD